MPKLAVFRGRHSQTDRQKIYKKTTYDKITNDGVQVENLDPTGLRKILLYTCHVLYTYCTQLYVYRYTGTCPYHYH